MTGLTYIRIGNIPGVPVSDEPPRAVWQIEQDRICSKGSSRFGVSYQGHLALVCSQVNILALIANEINQPDP
jgi:hypothetical protein